MLEPGVAAMGFELVDVELVGRGAQTTLRVYIDSPRGINVDDCADVSRQLSAILDVEDPLPQRYMLEVSSPGLDRPLVKPADYRRFVGEDVKLKLKQGIEGRRNFVGRLVEATEDRIVFAPGDKKGEAPTMTVMLDDIERARLVPKIDWTPRGAG